MIKHFGSPPASDSTPPLLGPRRSSTEAHEHLLIRMKRLERQQLRTLSEPLLPSAPPAQTSFSNLEYLAQPTYDPALPGLAWLTRRCVAGSANLTVKAKLKKINLYIIFLSIYIFQICNHFLIFIIQMKINIIRPRSQVTNHIYIYKRENIYKLYISPLVHFSSLSSSFLEQLLNKNFFQPIYLK